MSKTRQERGIDVTYDIGALPGCRSVPPSPSISARLKVVPTASGILTKWRSGSMASGCTCGAPSTRKARFSTCWCRNVGTRPPHRNCSGSCSRTSRARTGRNRHRRAGFVQGRNEGLGLSGPAPARSITRQQPGRKFASSCPTTRAEDATLQVRRDRPSFVSIHSAIYNTFNLQRHLVSRKTLRIFGSAAMVEWEWRQPAP